MGATAVDVDMLSTASRPSSKRSPFLSRGNGDSAILDEETSEYDFDSDGSDLDGSLPVTGFAVASHRRQVEFHAMFPSIDEGDYLIEGEWRVVDVMLMLPDYGCALSKDILVHGRLYVSENALCFHANIFGWVTDVGFFLYVLPLTIRWSSRLPTSGQSRRR